MQADLLTAHLARSLMRHAAGHQLCLPVPAARHELDGRDVVSAFATAGELTNDDFMGLTTTPCPLGAMKLVSDIAVRCATLREATVLAFSTLKMISPAAHFNLIENGKTAAVEIAFDDGGKDPDHILSQWHMVIWHKRSQWLIGAEIPLEQVEFAHPMQLGFAAYARMFGSNCVFCSDTNRLTFATSLLDRRVIRTPREMGRMLKTIVGNFVNPKTVARTWKQQTKHILQSDIENQRPLSTIENLASELHISGQTLRRRLKAEGTSYRLLKREVRRDAALDAMSGEDSTLGEASLKAGFAEPSGLIRSLRASRGVDAAGLRRQIEAWRRGTGTAAGTGRC